MTTDPAGEHDITGADLAPDGPISVEHWLGAPALSYPRRPRTVLDVLDRAVRRWPDAVAMQAPDGSATTYAGFADLVEGAADWLAGQGLRPGDPVAVASDNSLALAVLLFACARAGTVMVGLNTRLAPAQWAYVLEHSGVALALAAPAYDEGLRAAGARRIEPLEALLSRPVPWRYTHTEQPAEDATYAVVHTSGTTGRPKASQVVHRASVHSAISYQRLLQLDPQDRTAVLFPLYYISAMHAHVLPSMLAGASCVLLDSSAPRDFVAALVRERISWAYAVPSVWQLAVRLPEMNAEQLPALTRVGAGGAPFPARLVTALRARLPAVRLYDVYGLSETHSPATVLRDEEFADHPGSVGRLLPCMEAEIRGSEGTALPADAPGELWLRGSLVTTGYAGDPAATAAAIQDGWFDTGDIARIDPSGFVYILDRTKDMINRGGNKIFSAEVEALLREHPDIADAAVVAMPDALAGEAVAAFVVPAAGAELTPATVRGWVRDRMADYATPRHVHLLDDLPRNPTGKADKPLLREWARARTEQAG